VSAGTGSASITGPASWVAVDGATLNATGSKATFTAAADTATLKTSATGSVTVLAKDDNGAVVTSFGITVVDSCGSTTSPIAANTKLTISHTAGQAEAADATLTYAQKKYGQTVFVRVQLRNLYKGNVSAGLLTATATNGALIAFDGGDLLTSNAFQATAADDNDAVSLEVSQDADSNPGKALSTTVSFSFNGVAVGTKSVTILGKTASITVSDVTYGTSGDNDGTFKYVVKDNAGNQLDDEETITAAIDAGVLATSIVTAASADGDATTTAKGNGTFTCHAAGSKYSGKQTVSVGYLDATLTPVKATFDAVCGLDTVDTYTVSLDKASYNTGDIATLTIAGKDENGGAVSNAAVLGAAAGDVTADLAGMTAIGTEIAHTATFVNGVKTYKFRVDQSVGSFVGQVKIAADTDTSAKTLQYSIGTSNGGVSNADVLKAIVSLIASINKQIAALQKALLKKK
jgi:hypothetical protein